VPPTIDMLLTGLTTFFKIPSFVFKRRKKL